MPADGTTSSASSRNFAAGPGQVQLTGRLSIPPWIIDTPQFPGVEVLVLAKEGGSERRCARFELGVAGNAKPLTTLDLNAKVDFEHAGEICLEILPLPGGDPGSASIGVRKLHLLR